MCRDPLPVSVSEAVGYHRDSLTGLQVLEARRLGEREGKLRGIEHMKYDEIITATAEVTERVEHARRRLVEVGYHDDDAALPQVLSALAERRIECGRLRLAAVAVAEAVEGVEHMGEVPRAGWYVLEHVALEGYEAHPVALALREPEQARREEARVIELGNLAAAIPHRRRAIQQHHDCCIGLRFELLEVEPVGPRPELPVEPPQVVAREVGAMLREIGREPEVRRAVEPAHETLDHRAREQLQVRDAREDTRIDEPRPPGYVLARGGAHRFRASTSGPARRPGASR